MGQDNFPDFVNFIYFDDRVEFEPNKYKRPEIYFGFKHVQYLVPHILGLKNKKKSEEKKKKIIRHQIKKENKSKKKSKNEKNKERKLCEKFR